MDLGGVDVAGSRSEPREGDPLYGLYQHKRAFGGRWLELTGAHERVFDPRGYALGASCRPPLGHASSMTDRTLADLLRAAEPSDPRPLGSLIERLAADGSIRGARLDGRAIGPVALADVAVHGVTHDSRSVTSPAACSSPSPASTSTATSSSRPPRPGAPPPPIVERPVPDVALPQLVVASSPIALARSAAWWYGDPSRELAVVGVTGTDGKTTTSMLAVAALEACGLGTGLISTAMARIGGISEPNEAHATTPEAAGPPGGAPGDDRGRRPGRGHRDDLPRAGPPPRRRDRL